MSQIIDIPLSDQIKSFMDNRHYDPAEIPTLKMEPNDNGEKTWYIDSVNGNDSWDGLHPDHIPGTNQGPNKTTSRATDRYAGRRYGERILFKAGYHRIKIGGGNFQGDSTKVNSYGPYGDGEVVLDLSMTPGLDEFENVTGDLWRAKFGPDWPDGPEGSVHWAVMDWNFRSCREAIGYKGQDNSGVDEKEGSLTDTTRDFVNYVKESGSGQTDLIGAFVFNITTGAIAVVSSVTTTTTPNDTLNFEVIVGGTRNTFNSGDRYAVYQLNQDGRFASVGEYFYLLSTNGEPRARNLIANKKDSDNGYVPIYIGAQNYHFYGLTIVGAPSIGIMTLGDDHDVTYEKCRVMFTGKHATTQFPRGRNVHYIKNFFYANVMMNWPRGNVWGGNGGWPNNINGRAAKFNVFEGNLSLFGGGEGLPTGDIVKDNIVVDAYSMLIYVGDQNDLGSAEIFNNAAIFTGYRPNDALERFYLDIHYNGFQRNYVKMHPNGITIGVEKSGGEYTPKVFHVHHNYVIGAWHGLNGYFEWAEAGYKDAIFEDNTVVLMTAEDIPPFMYTPHSGMKVYARQGRDNNAIFRRNRIIGANNADGRHNLIAAWGSDFGVVTVNNNFYHFPNNDRFLLVDLHYLDSVGWDQYRQETGWDADSTLSAVPGVQGTDFSDSSLITKQDLEPVDGWPGENPDPGSSSVSSSTSSESSSSESSDSPQMSSESSSSESSSSESSEEPQSSESSSSESSDSSSYQPPAGECEEYEVTISIPEIVIPGIQITGIIKKKK